MDESIEMDKFSFVDRMRIPTYDDPDHMKSAELTFDPQKCKQCGRCILLCPGGCILTDSLTKMDIWERGAKVKGSGVPHLDSIKPGVSLCIGCFDCGTACPEGAIGIERHFNPGYFFKRITQTAELRYPKTY